MVLNSVLLPGNPGVAVERDVALDLADGTSLLSDIYRPDNVSSDLPVILIRAPYDKRQAENIGYSHPSWYARHGYMVVSQDTRGRYASGGEWYPFLNEAADGVAAIGWAAGLPGSNGRVGMYGFSYGGATQLMPAIERPPALMTVCPAFTGSQYYDGWTYQGGAFSLAFAASWALSLGIHNAARRGDEGAAGQLGAAFASAMQWHYTLPLSAYPPLQGEDTGYFRDWLEHPSYDDYWQRWSIDEHYDDIDLPALHIGGWYDIFLRGTIRNFQGLRTQAASEKSRQQQRLVIGPWFHMPWYPVGGASEKAAGGTTIDDLQLEWFNTHLKGMPPSQTSAAVTIWVNGAEAWRDFDTWPPSGCEPLQLFLQSNGRANSKFGDGAAFHRSNWWGTAGHLHL